MGAVISMILDGMVLILLAATIFFAARLSLHLKVFRQSRKDLDKLLASLSDSITRAEKAIEGMHEAARESGRDMQGLMDDAKAQADELQLMTEAGNALAGRLEALAERNRQPSARQDRDETDMFRSEEDFAQAPSIPKKHRKPPVESLSRGRSVSGFAIRDPEFDRGEMNESKTAGNDSEEEAAFAETLHSRAERELYEALHGGGKKSGTRGTA
ncbi:MAG: hypothetical protein H6868_05320 [Rhodospirillales bacterium]|nr:hypothetical protein [Rhodospirillales bacterium]